MKYLKIILIILFIALVSIKLFFPIYLKLQFDIPGIIILLLLIAVVAFRNKLTHAAGIVLSGYGTCDFIYRAYSASRPGPFEFTSSLNYLIFGGRTESTSWIIINLLPLLFYFIFLVILLTKKGRTAYIG